MIMGEVVATIKVMPVSPETDLEQLKADIESSIPDDAEFHKIEEELVAFGLIALNTMVVVDDGEGGTEATEAALNDLSDVESIQVTDVRRLM